MQPTRSFTATLLLLASTLGGCLDPAPEGEAGVLGFSYVDPTIWLGEGHGNRIALGTQLTLAVDDIDGEGPDERREPALILGVDIEPAGVVALASVDGDHLVLDARAPGSAVVTVETERGRDSLPVGVAEAASTGGVPWLGFEGPLIAVRGAVEELIVLRRDEDGRHLLGVAPAMMSAGPAGAVTAIPRGDGAFSVRYDRVGLHEVQAGWNTYTRRVIAPNEIGRFDLSVEMAGQTLGVGDTAFGFPDIATIAGEDVPLVHGALEIESLTPAVCSVTFDAGLQVAFHVLTIEALAPGQCVVEGRLDPHVDRAVLTVE